MHHRGSCLGFFIYKVGEKITFFFQFCHTPTPRACEVMILAIRAPDWGPDNHQERQHSPLSPDVAQERVYGETRLNLIIP